MNSNVLAALLNRISVLEERMNSVSLNAVQPWHNLGAGATTPTVNDDSSLGYGKGSVWVSDSATYICRDSTVGAAVWDDVSGGGGFGGDVDDLTTNTGVAGQMVRVAGAGGLEYRSPSQVRTDIGATTIGGNVLTSTNPSAISFARANADNTFSWLSASAFRTAIGGTTIGSNVFTSTNPSAITFARANADNSLSWLSASAFRTAIGATTVGGNFFTATNPSAVTFVRVNADNTVSFLSAASFITALNLDGLYVTLATPQTISASKVFTGGVDLGYSTSASLVATRLTSVLLPRWADLTYLRMQDYQDEAALWETRPLPYDSITASTAPTAGASTLGNMFLDDSSSAGWSSGTPFPLTITIDSTTNPIAVKNNATWQVGLTFRSSGVTVTNIEVEIWDGAGYITVHNAAPGSNGENTSGFGYWISPQFLSDIGTGYDIQRLRITIDGDNGAIASGFRIQRLLLYHDTAQWDTFAYWRNEILLDKFARRSTPFFFHARSDGTVTITSHALAEQFLSNGNRNIHHFDLSTFTQCRIVARVTTGSASPNNPRFIAKYRLVSAGFSTTVSDYVNLGTSEVSASLASAGSIASSWTNIATAALDQDCLLTVTQIGGNGAASPVYCMLSVQFR